MKKKMSMLCMLLLLMITASVAASAQENISQNTDGTLILTGTVSDSVVMAVEIVKADFTQDDLKTLTDDNVKETVFFIGNYKPDAGDYEIEITLPDTAHEGNYVARVNSVLYSKAVEIPFYYADVEKINAIFEKFVSPQTTEAEAVALLNNKENCTVLGLTGFYWDLGESSRAAIAKNTYADRSEMENFLDLRETFEYYCALEAIANPTEKINAVELIEEYAEKIGINGYEKYADYAAMSAAQMKTVAEKLEGKNLVDNAARKIAFNEAVVLTEIGNAVGIIDIRSAITKNKDYFPADSLDEYLDRTNTGAIDSAVSAREFTTLSELAAFIQEKLEENTQTTTPGGGSGGGSGGGKSTVNASTSLEFEDNRIQNTAMPIFEDLSDVQWAKEAIEYLAASGVVNGKAEGIFDPNSPVTREEFVKMLSEAFQLKLADKEPEFKDTDKNMWYYPYIVKAYSSGLVKGVDEKNFGVGLEITRQDMAVMVYRFLSYRGAMLPDGAVTEFTDKAKIGEYAREAVSSLRACGVVMGMTDGSFAPLETCTRAQAAKIIYSALKYAGMTHIK